MKLIFNKLQIDAQQENRNIGDNDKAPESTWQGGQNALNQVLPSQSVKYKTKERGTKQNHNHQRSNVGGGPSGLLKYLPVKRPVDQRKYAGTESPYRSRLGWRSQPEENTTQDSKDQRQGRYHSDQSTPQQRDTVQGSRLRWQRRSEFRLDESNNDYIQGVKARQNQAWNQGPQKKITYTYANLVTEYYQHQTWWQQLCHGARGGNNASGQLVVVTVAQHDG